MSFDVHQVIELKDDSWFDKQKIAASCVSEILETCEDAVITKSISNVLELNSIIDPIFKKYDCTPTFLGYYGFPSMMCVSINEEVVHGIIKDRKLESGDVIKFDVGATTDGAIADSALTCIFGDPKDPLHLELLEKCRNALYEGIKAAKVGNNIGHIGHAIFSSVKNTNFGLIKEYGGHGINKNKLHAAPFVPNKSKPSDGPRIQNNMAIAIEPMLVAGLPVTSVQSDKWTVKTGGISAHFEHSLFITNEKTHIMTKRKNENII